MQSSSGKFSICLRGNQTTGVTTIVVNNRVKDTRSCQIEARNYVSSFAYVKRFGCVKLASLTRVIRLGFFLANDEF